MYWITKHSYDFFWLVGFVLHTSNPSCEGQPGVLKLICNQMYWMVLMTPFKHTWVVLIQSWPSSWHGRKQFAGPFICLTGGTCRSSISSLEISSVDLFQGASPKQLQCLYWLMASSACSRSRVKMFLSTPCCWEYSLWVFPGNCTSKLTSIE